MRWLDTVRFKDLHPAMVLALWRIEDIYEAHGTELWMTSGNDGKHMEGSKHYSGRAVDLRTKTLKGVAAKRTIRDAAALALGPMFKVLLERSMKKEWEILHRLADGATPEFRRAFLKAVMASKADIPIGKMTAALNGGDFEVAFRLAVDAWEKNAGPWRNDTSRQLRDVLEKAGQAAEQFLPRSITASFDVTNPEAVRWAGERSTTLLDQVTVDTKRAIRRIIARSFREGIPVQQIARDLREVVGLTERQAESIVRYRSQILGLAARKTAGGDLQDAIKKQAGRQRIPARRGLTAQRIETLVDRYRQRLLRERAETIARTETMEASNQGQLQLWKQAVNSGLITESQTKRKFIVTPDDRLCDICAPMRGQIRGLNEPFVSPKNGAQRTVPPIHPRCRCAVGLVIQRQQRAQDVQFTQSQLNKAFGRKKFSILDSFDAAELADREAGGR